MLSENPAGRRILAIIFLMALIPAAGSRSVAGVIDMDGKWEGRLSVQGVELRLVFRIERTEEETFRCSLDSPDQGAVGLPVEEITLDGDSLHVNMIALRAEYHGLYDWEKNCFEGEWRQSGGSFPLIFKKTSEESKILRPQTPKAPYPYIEKEVTFKGSTMDETLAGTLTMPGEGSGFPAVVLISGSGQQDRDETIFGHKPFLVLADHLTRKGIAVLRYDDRGVGGSSGDVSHATSEDFAGDVAGAIQYLRNRPQIDADKIGLIGHSEGGIIAPIVASRRPDVAFIVMMAGTGIKGSEVLLLQTEAILRAGGLEDDLLAKILHQKKIEIEIFRREADNGKAIEQMIEASTGYLSNYTESELEKTGFSREMIEQTANIYATPWFRFFMTFDPSEVLEKIRCPVLAINGSLDLQVLPSENLARIKEALEKGNHPDFTLVELPGLNHLFQTCRTGSPDEYADIEETISPSALEAISDWILKKTE